MENRSLLAIIAIILIGIFAILFVQMNQEPDTLSEQINEAFEEVGDEIDDNMTVRN